MSRAEFTAALLEWGTRERRDLPWRRTRDPWSVLVSEIMLQQTQVARVVEPYGRFLTVFPTIESCAAAPVADVVRAWRGLGYNRRAMHLHACARTCVDEHDSRVPDDLDALLALPGVGRYTARAVLAFAYGRDVAPVDTNAARVLARAVAGRRLTQAETQRHADALVPAQAGWAWGQAMLDLGAQHCRAQPQCQRCPVAAACAWKVAGSPDPDPAAGSFGTGHRQSRFAGSDREGRGRLVDALRRAPVAAADLASVLGWPADAERARRVAATVVGDGIAVAEGEWLRLAE